MSTGIVQNKRVAAIYKKKSECVGRRLMSIAIIQNANKLGFLVGKVYDIRALRFVIAESNTVSSFRGFGSVSLYIKKTISCNLGCDNDNVFAEKPSNLKHV